MGWGMLSGRKSGAAAAVMTLIVGALLVGPLAAIPAVADEDGGGKNTFLTLTKTVQNTGEKTADGVALVRPGVPLTYTLFVGCNQEDCVDVRIEDQLPEAFAGFSIVDTQVHHAGASEVPQVQWVNVDGNADQTATARADSILTVTPQQSIAGGDAMGIGHGKGVTVTITLQAPTNLTPSWEWNEAVITNVARVTADNAASVEDSASVVVSVDKNVSVSVTKDWQPAKNYLQVGSFSQVSLAIANESNISVSALSLQDPQQAEDGAISLSADNPFQYHNFGGFSDFHAPPGASQVTTSVYVRDEVSGTYGWVSGMPSDVPALPEGITTDQVAGVRLDLKGTFLANGEPGEVKIDLSQRATGRESDQPLAAAIHTNVVEGSAQEADLKATKTARASHSVEKANVGVTISKNITAAHILTGGSTAATIVAKAWNIPAQQLRMVDLGYFDGRDVIFGGFTAPPSPPQSQRGDVTGAIVWHYLDATDSGEIALDGGIPHSPRGNSAVQGFEIIWTSPSATITTGSETRAVFEIIGGTDLSENPVNTSNTATAISVTPVGSATSSSSDTLVVGDPTLQAQLVKKITPAGGVRPGELVLTTLTPSYSSSSTDVNLTHVTVEDSAEISQYQSEGAERVVQFWDAFDLYSVPAVGIPAGVGLQVMVEVSGNWQQVANLPARSESHNLTLTHAQLESAVSQGLGNATGIKFVFTDPTGITSTLQPHVIYQARQTQRTSGNPTSDEGFPAGVEYSNTAQTSLTGVIGEHTKTDSARAEATAKVIPPVSPGSETGKPGSGAAEAITNIAKRWAADTAPYETIATLPPLLSAQARTPLTWQVAYGQPWAVIEDHADTSGLVTDVSRSSFDAFDLLAVDPIGNSAVQNTNGWALRWDKIAAVEIFDGSLWKTPENCSSTDGNLVQLTVNDKGVPTAAQFLGCTLTTAEQDWARGVRIRVEENTDARVASVAANTPAPLPGSGVVSTAARDFTLQWRLRDTTRSDANTSVIPSTVFSSSGEGGVIRNSAAVSVPDGRESAEASIALLPAPHSVTVTSTVRSLTGPTNSRLELRVPPGGELPSVVFEADAKSAGPMKPSYLRVGDPTPCEGQVECAWQSDPMADPFAPAQMPEGGWLTPENMEDNAFDHFTITAIKPQVKRPGDDSWAQEVKDSSTVWVLFYTGGDPADTSSYTSTQYSMAQAEALKAQQLRNAVGVCATFAHHQAGTAAGFIEESDTFSVAITARLREATRSGGEATTMAPNTEREVTNLSFAQTWEPLLNQDKASAASAKAVVVLKGETIAVSPKKTITPTQVIAAEREKDVNVVLRADSANSTLGPRQVILRDDSTDSADFWSALELQSIGQIIAPQGANQLRIDLFDGSVWVEGPDSSLTNPRLPSAVTIAQARGIRVTFFNTLGDTLTTHWSTQIPLVFSVREDYSFPSTGTRAIDNYLSVRSLRVPDQDQHPENTGWERTKASINLASGTHSLAVNKEANGGSRSVQIGQTVPWTLTFTNTGTGYLTIDKVVDYLGDTASDGTPDAASHLGLAQPSTTTFATTAGGLLATEGISEDYDAQTREITWRLPEGGRTMAPGETFTITTDIELLPGISSGVKAYNTMTVHTLQPLTGNNNTPACANIDHSDHGNRMGVIAGSQEHSCGTRDYVTPSQSLNLYVEKGVWSALGSALAVDGSQCQPTIAGLDGTGYFSAGCIGQSQYSTDDNVFDKWVLRTSNTTTRAVEKLVLFDELPGDDDHLLIGGARRSSTYRTVLQGAPTIYRGNTIITEGVTIEVTEDNDACVDTWDDLNANPGAAPCSSQSALWVVADADTNWSAVRALRIAVDLSVNPLQNGEIVDAVVPTHNVIVAESGPTGLSQSVPTSRQQAWNQHGLQWKFLGDSAPGRAGDAGDWSQRIPAPVGLEPAVGSLQISKSIAGDAAEHAPTSFNFHVSCTIASPQAVPGGSTQLDLPQGGNLTVSRAEDGTYTPARIDGIPLGAVCTATETDNGGASWTQAATSQVTISEVGNVDDPVPSTQTIAFTNHFEAGTLQVTKERRTIPEDSYGFGPFTVQASCQLDGRNLSLPEDGNLILGKDNGYTASLSGLPVGAQCSLTETDAGPATISTVNPAAITVPGPEGGHVQTAEVSVVNGFSGGYVEVTKALAGNNAQFFMESSFEFSAECVLPDNVSDFIGDLRPRGTVHVGETWRLGPYPAGTECVISEENNGAGHVSFAPSNQVTIPLGEDPATPTSISVTATNTFDGGTMSIKKLRVGPGAEKLGAGPFEATAECSYQEPNGDTHTYNPVTVQLSASNGYTAHITDLLVGTQCQVRETEAAGGLLTEISPSDGKVVIGDSEAEPVQVILTNTFPADVVPPSEELSHTGFDNKLLTGAILLLLVGAALVVTAKRRGQL